MALAEIDHPEYENYLLQMFRHPDSWMRTSGLWLLSKLKLEHMLEKAFDLCDDHEAHVRIHAIRAISEIAKRNMVHRLSPCLTDPVNDVRDEAKRTIKKLNAME
jgi:HEAT repeat protein